MKSNLFNYVVLFSLVSILAKMYIFQGLNLAEAFLGFSTVAFFAFNKYVDWKKAKEVEVDFQERLRNLENKMGWLTGGTNLVNAKKNARR